MVSMSIASLSISCAAPTARMASSDGQLSALPLARFMRESVNVPFSFVMLEPASARREHRVHRAAIVLREAARDLIHWDAPPGLSDAGREVFYAYAANLETQVARLEDAAAHHEQDMADASVEQIRQTCNSCHRFFRPASVLSPDVAFDEYALDLGGFR